MIFPAYQFVITGSMTLSLTDPLLKYGVKGVQLQIHKRGKCLKRQSYRWSMHRNKCTAQTTILYNKYNCMF